MTAPACRRCRRPLRDEASKQRRYGPVCFRREFGPPAPKPRGGATLPAAVRTVDHHPADPNQIPLPLEATVPAVDSVSAHDDPRPVATVREGQIR
ncbi:DUF6011 domain-containing protein [Streptomyces sp. AA4]|uniref:DUF6011 domain-containing protein n=1 Tax=Actinomycetes TaxID=1760 RepID=UPI0001DEE4C1|nr:predicted protein [Streptomyces sp. AA4]